jgi:predicted metal-binding membrane protein
VLAILAALGLLAWLTLADPLDLGIASAFDHHELLEDASGSQIVARFPLFVGAWVLMTAAMMLASTLPTQQAVAALSPRAGGVSPSRATLLFSLAYLVVWTAFGVLAFATDVGLHEAVERVTYLEEHELLIPGALMLGAGVYQFSGLKDRCLTVCRTPMSFVMTRWRPGARGAFRMGIDHGIYCLGCCWPLMLLMLAFMAAGLALLALATLYFFAEKVLVHGDAVSRATGRVLIAGGVAVVILGFASADRVPAEGCGPTLSEFRDVRITHPCAGTEASPDQLLLVGIDTLDRESPPREVGPFSVFG